jgi:formylglycine-generating enzyme required for sulfatase activity
MTRIQLSRAGILLAFALIPVGLRSHAPKSISTSAHPEMQPYAETIPGTKVSFEMIPVPGGTFLMGSPSGENRRSPDEGPQHFVTIRPFWIGKTEVKWDEYDVFAFKRGIRTAGPELSKQSESEKIADAISRPTPPYEDETFGYGRRGYPVINITHHAAMEYSRWLSLETGKDYRIPTEAEWEYACRAGTSTAFFFGDDPSKLSDYAWFLDDAKVRPHPVGEKLPNPWGIQDILGNVAEWVLDRYDKDYYSTFRPDVPALLPVLLPGKEKFPHVVRGGGWVDPNWNLRCASRLASTEVWLQQDPQRPQSIWWLTDALFVGFRLVRPLEEQDNLKGLKSQVKRYDD